jgi:peptidoglycan/LPS O-acetylase OafA/YrhL
MMVRRLLLLNGLAAFAVVLYHSSAWGFISMFWWTHRYTLVTTPNFDQIGSLNYYGLRVIEQAVIFAIPAFLFVSGYFIAFATGRNQRTVRWKVVLVRIKNLAIPFLIWSVLILGADMLTGVRYTVDEFLLTLFTGQTEPPFYYVPALIQLLLLSVLLVPLARDRWKLLLLVTALIQLTMLSVEYMFILRPEYSLPKVLLFLQMSWLFPRHIFWFSFGIVFGFHLPQLKNKVTRTRWVFLVVLVITFFLGIAEWEMLLRLSGQDWISPRETFIDQLYAAAFLLSFLAYEKFIPIFHKQLSEFGDKSYGIYLVHSPVLEYTARAIYHLLPWLLAYQIVMQPVLVVMGLGVPLLLMTLMARSPIRNYYKYLFG